MRLLIAEGSPVLRNIFRERLRNDGFKFDIVSNGETAVMLAQRNQDKYDLCLMDINLPSMNGIEAVRLIRRTVKYFPIIALATAGRDWESAQQAGVDACLLKAGQYSQLVAMIRELTIKSYRIANDSGASRIEAERPQSKQQADQLRHLGKNGLCRLALYENTDKSLIVHRNVPVKISHDFEVKRCVMTSFLNRDRETPTLCYLFRESHLMPQVVLVREEYDIMLREEDAILSNYTGIPSPQRME
jgi:CheY-like chemotaxis protein